MPAELSKAFGDSQDSPAMASKLGNSHGARPASRRSARWHSQVNLITRNRWAMSARGFLALSLAVLVLISPGPSLLAIAWLFGSYALLDGVLTLFAALRTAGKNESWWGLVMEGASGILAGLLVIVWPWVDLFFVCAVIAVWAVVTGGFEIAVGARLRREIGGELWLTLCGISSILFGILMLYLWEAALKFLPWLIGSYALAFGSLLITLSAQLRSLEAKQT